MDLAHRRTNLGARASQGRTHTVHWLRVSFAGALPTLESRRPGGPLWPWPTLLDWGSARAVDWPDYPPLLAQVRHNPILTSTSPRSVARMPEAVVADSKATRREWVGLAVIALPCVLYAMDLTVLNLAVPHLSADLKPTSAQLLWILDIYGFFVAGSLITMGTLGDRIGRRRLLLQSVRCLAACFCSISGGARCFCSGCRSWCWSLPSDRSCCQSTAIPTQ